MWVQARQAAHEKAGIISTMSASDLDAIPDVPSVPTLAERTLAVLDHVTQAAVPPGLMDIANALNLPKATASRLCANLEAQHWLVRHEDRSFSPGPRLMRLALSALQSDLRQALRHQVLADLVKLLDETCNFTVLDGTQVRYLDRVETHWPLRMQLEVGSRVPLHATASGKLFLAYMTPTRRAAVLQHLTLNACTPHTITQLPQLERECAQIQAQGFSCDREEFMLGMIAVAVPVLDAEGTCRAGLAVHAPAARMSLAQAQAALPQLRDTAVALGALML